jgi:hypothetical protein
MEEEESGRKGDLGGGGVSLKIGVVGYLETVSPAKVDHLGNK